MTKYLLTLLATAAIALGVDVTFVWDPNPPGDGVTEYRIYEVESGAYTLKTTVGGQTTRATVEGLVMDRDRVFVATAFNGLESDYSDEALVEAVKPCAPQQFKREITFEFGVKGKITEKIIPTGEMIINGQPVVMLQRIVPMWGGGRGY